MRFLDLSYWNNHAKPIDFSKVSGYKGVILKLTEGATFVDPTAKQRAQSVLDAGLQLGYYHFATTNKTDVITDARTEAIWFLKQLALHPKPTLFTALDIETNSVHLKESDLALWIDTFMTYSDCSVLYSYSSFFKELINADIKLKGYYDLWIAQYSRLAPVPNKFESLGNPKYWQFSSKGVVHPIAGHVDLNISLTS